MEHKLSPCHTLTPSKRLLLSRFQQRQVIINGFNTLNLGEGNATDFRVNGRHYSCVKRNRKGEVLYIFFSPELHGT